MMDGVTRRLVFPIALLLAAASFSSCYFLGPGEQNVSPPPGVFLVSKLHLIYQPSGKSSPWFTEYDHPGPPLKAVRSLIPVPLPSPLAQSCTVGTDVVATLGSGRIVTFGPCSYPASIAPLKRAMLAYLARNP